MGQYPTHNDGAALWMCSSPLRPKMDRRLPQLCLGIMSLGGYRSGGRSSGARVGESHRIVSDLQPATGIVVSPSGVLPFGTPGNLRTQHPWAVDATPGDTARGARNVFIRVAFRIDDLSHPAGTWSAGAYGDLYARSKQPP